MGGGLCGRYVGVLHSRSPNSLDWRPHWSQASVDKNLESQDPLKKCHYYMIFARVFDNSVKRNIYYQQWIIMFFLMKMIQNILSIVLFCWNNLSTGAGSGIIPTPSEIWNHKTIYIFTRQWIFNDFLEKFT